MLITLFTVIWLKVCTRKYSVGTSWGSVVRTRHFHLQVPGSIPGWGTKILEAMWCGQERKGRGKEEGGRERREGGREEILLLFYV